MATKALTQGTIETPTDERLARAAGYVLTHGRGRQKRHTMMDDNLGRLVLKKILSQDQYVALQRYALHWYHAGLAGVLSSFDLNRVRTLSAGLVYGLVGSERTIMHKRWYYDARLAIGETQAYVADMVACHDYPLHAAGVVLGYASEHRGRDAARQLLAEAGSRLHQFWLELDKRPRKG